MAVRKKRSISIPPELDAEIAAAAEAAGMSYSAWVAQTARKEFTIRAGLEAVGQYEAEHGTFTPAEIAEADQWAARVIPRASVRRSA
jgi:hypothetical protein